MQADEELDPTKEELDRLTKPKIDSALYFALIEGKSQSDAARFIYKTENLRRVNQKSIISARRRLMSAKYVRSIDSEYRIKNPTLLTTPTPIIEYASKKLMSRSGKSESYDFSENEKDALYKILDSKWFRSLFSESKLSNYVYWDSDERKFVVINGAMPKMADILGEIASIGFVFLHRHPLANKIPQLTDFNQNEDFDSFADAWVKKHLKAKRELITRIIREGGQYYGQEAVEKLLAYSENLYCMCIPQSLIDKLVRVGRIELTLIIGLEGAM